MLTTLLTRRAATPLNEQSRTGRPSTSAKLEGPVDARRAPASTPRGQSRLRCASCRTSHEAGEQVLKGMACRWTPTDPVKVKAHGVRKERLVANLENTVMIRKPIEQVFGFLPTSRTSPGGITPSSRLTRSPRGPVGVGTIYQQVRSVPRRSEERFEVTAHNPPRQLAIRGQLGSFPSRLSYALDAVPEGTRVTNSVELKLRGPGRLLGPVAVPRVRDAVAANLRKLKELLEQ
jgi:LSD1 subclass zinc finger protein